MPTLLFQFLLTIIAQVDTLTSVYSEKWEGIEADQSAFVLFMTSNDMIFVVLGVSLIIWFVLLSFIVRAERRIKSLEDALKSSN